MDDGRDAVVAAHLLDEWAVVDVAPHERRAEQGVGPAELEGVEDDDLTAGITEGADGVRADVAGPACDEDRHGQRSQVGTGCDSSGDLKAHQPSDRWPTVASCGCIWRRRHDRPR